MATDKKTEREGVFSLNDDQIAEIEALTDDGVLPRQIAEKLNISVRAAQNARRAYKISQIRESTSATGSPTTTHGVVVPPTLDPVAAALQQVQADALQEARVSSLMDQLRSAAERRRLELRQVRLDQRQQELDMLRQEHGIDADFPVGSDYQDADEEEPPGDEETPDVQDYNFDKNPLGAAMSFIRDLKGMSAAKTASLNTTLVDASTGSQTRQPTNPMSDIPDEEIDAQIALMSPAQLAQAKAAIGTPLESQLRQLIAEHYPAARSDKNMARILAAIKAKVTP